VPDLPQGADRQLTTLLQKQNQLLISYNHR